MPFDNLIIISRELEENLRNLEDELRDASTFIYSGLDQQSTKSEDGVNLLNSLVEKFEGIYDDIVKGNDKGEEEVRQSEEEIETFKQHYEELNRIQAETEAVLAKKNLLELTSSPALLENSTVLNVNNGTLSPLANNSFLISRKLQTSTPSEYDGETTYELL